MRRCNWKHFDFVAEGLFVGLEHANHVLAVFFFADEQAALDVLRFAAGLDDVAAGIFLDVLDGVVEGLEFSVGNDVDAGFLQLFLAEGAIVFQAVGVFGAADDGLTLLCAGLGLCRPGRACRRRR